MSTTSTDHKELQTDHSWDNRRLILASLAPRTTPRPARRGSGTAVVDDDTANKPATPGLFNRGIHAGACAGRAVAHQFNKRVPPTRRLHTVTISAAAIAVLLVALTGIRNLASAIAPQPATPTPAAAAPPPARTALTRDTILADARASDVCPRDADYADANLALDGDLNTAWVCTRAKNTDGQYIQVNFGRQVTLTQIRVDGGFDGTAPDHTDQWSKHRIVTKLEIWFPKDLNRQPVTIDTGGARDYRGIPGGLQPPATVSKLLIRIKETSDPPQPATATTEASKPSPDDNDTKTVAVSEIQFIGYDGPSA